MAQGRFSRSTINTRRALETLIPKGVSLHTVRHTHASRLLEEGAGLATISERMGHPSVRTAADSYSHAIRGKDREVAEMWDKIMQPAREASRSKVAN